MGLVTSGIIPGVCWRISVSATLSAFENSFAGIAEIQIGGAQDRSDVCYQQ